MGVLVWDLGMISKLMITRFVQVALSWQYDEYAVEVYSMETDCWRELDGVDIPGSIFWYSSFEMYFKGICYWWATDNVQDQNKEVICLFDMGDEIS
ncbi:hypothetical protein Pyn_08603 [Prunus yedoensis var. nudiflora]|uniref:F-box associated beta-propeller type 1 domain-containing protein n=1 Tax=Prunus yedoensis var. nudiflora TaxID=2094558 RepID=A0A314ZNB5_PRUYE|nr:hypothetical protein Pyn_08603 [Prunus yedoensis var. nudiflora]